MASLIDVGSETTRDSKWLLFSNPNSATQRHRLTIKGSPDRGLTWPPQHQLLIDEGLSAGYSCMTMIDDETIGIIYEGSQSDMTFQRIALDSISQ
jgi:sialidase-1